MITTVKFSEGSSAEEPKRSSPGKMQKEVDRDKALRQVDRVDKPDINGQKPHVHYKDGTSSNWDGSIHDAHKREPNVIKSVIEWLQKHNWTPPQPPSKK